MLVMVPNASLGGDRGIYFFYYFIAMNILLSPKGVFFGKRSDVLKGLPTLN
jgi:hypothetical protein